ncbi:MAG TPA: hypothetical protein VGF84_02655, partial [Micromonosporaceae bacterium]
MSEATSRAASSAGRDGEAPDSAGPGWATRLTGNGVVRGVRTALRPSGLRGTAVEVAWIAAHLATYPLGVAQEK